MATNNLNNNKKQRKARYILTYIPLEGIFKIISVYNKEDFLWQRKL